MKSTAPALGHFGAVDKVSPSQPQYSPVWPDGKKHARNVYAHSKAECEKLLAAMIAEMKAEIAAEKERLKATSKASSQKSTAHRA